MSSPGFAPPPKIPSTFQSITCGESWNPEFDGFRIGKRRASGSGNRLLLSTSPPESPLIAATASWPLPEASA